MNLIRACRHLYASRWRMRRQFSAPVRTAIEQAISAAESTHGGEICFVVESALSWPALWRDQTPRQRALEVFARLAVWDTEANNGVLIYVALADHAVEIVADRGINARVPAAQWELVCREVEQQFGTSQFADGARAAVTGVARALQQHFPNARPDANELPNQPILL